MLEREGDRRVERPRLSHGIVLPFRMILLCMAVGCVPAGLVFTSVSVLALPAQVKAMEPSAAAAINSAAVVIAAIVNLSGVGWGSAADYFGRRPIALAGCAIMVVATAIQVGAVYRNDTLGLGLFLVGYIFVQLGLTMVGVIWAALVSDFSRLYPERAGLISALFYLFFNLGAILGVAAAGAVLPVTPVCHGFWWLLLAVSISWLLAVALIPRVTYEAVPAPLEERAQARAEAAALRASLGLAASGLRYGLGSMSKTEGWDSSLRASGAPNNPSCAEAPGSNPAPPLAPPADGRGPILSMLCALMLGREYRAFRAVTMARTLYYAAVGIFQASALYFVDDYIAPPPDGVTFLGYIVVASLALVMVLAAPVGWLADRIGPFWCVIASTICLSALFFALPFADSKEILIVLAAPYGLGLVFYVVADLFLLIEALPDPSKAARDIGFWNSFQYVGNAIGAAFAGGILSAFSEDTGPPLPSNTSIRPTAEKTSSCAAPSSIDTLYGLTGYRIIFFVAASFTLLSGVFIVFAREALRSQSAVRLERAGAKEVEGEFKADITEALLLPGRNSRDSFK